LEFSRHNTPSALCRQPPPTHTRQVQRLSQLTYHLLNNLSSCPAAMSTTTSCPKTPPPTPNPEPLPRPGPKLDDLPYHSINGRKTPPRLRPEPGNYSPGTPSGRTSGPACAATTDDPKGGLISPCPPEIILDTGVQARAAATIFDAQDTPDVQMPIGFDLDAFYAPSLGIGLTVRSSDSPPRHESKPDPRALRPGQVGSEGLMCTGGGRLRLGVLAAESSPGWWTK